MQGARVWSLGWGTKFLHATQSGQKKKSEKLLEGVKQRNKIISFTILKYYYDSFVRIFFLMPGEY